MQTRTPDRKDRNCPAVEQPFVTVVRLFQEKIHVCEQLEGVADSLPDKVDRCKCASLAYRVPSLLSICGDIHEFVISPMLLQQSPHIGLSKETVSRLTDERRMDQGYALEVSELLDQLACVKPLRNIEASAYMLRGFFESVKRSSAFDLECVVPLVRRHIDGPANAILQELLRDQSQIVAPACTKTRRTLKNRKQPQALQGLKR